MKALAPKISLIGWCYCLAVHLAMLFAYPPTSALSSTLATVIGLGVLGAGIVLSAFLSQRPNRGQALLLVGLCLFALWRFHVGGIAFKMLPQMGGLTFRAALADWWQRSTSSTVHFFAAVPSVAFLCVSLAFWPVYILVQTLTHDKTKDHLT